MRFKKKEIGLLWLHAETIVSVLYSPCLPSRPKQAKTYLVGLLLHLLKLDQSLLVLELNHEGEDKEQGRGGEDPGRVSEKVGRGLAPAVDSGTLVRDGLAGLGWNDVLECPDTIEDGLDVVDIVLVLRRVDG